MNFEESICKLAADIAAVSPALVKKAVEALGRSSRACAAADTLIHLFLGTFYVIPAAAFFGIIADRVCGRECAVTVASVTGEIAGYTFIASLILSVPAFVLFFLRAAGSTSELAEGLIMKDLNERHSSAYESLQSPLLSAAGRLFACGFWLGIIMFILLMCGYPEIADLLGEASSLCFMACPALIFLRAAMALRRMNPRPSNIVVAEAE